MGCRVREAVALTVLMTGCQQYIVTPQAFYQASLRAHREQESPAIAVEAKPEPTGNTVFVDFYTLRRTRKAGLIALHHGVRNGLVLLGIAAVGDTIGLTLILAR